MARSGRLSLAVVGSLLFVAMLVVLPAAVAKGGAPLSSSNNQLWVQYTNDPSCCETWMGTIKDDPAFSGSGNFGTGMVGPDGEFSWEWALEPTPSAAVALDPTGTIDATVFLVGLPGTSPSVGAGALTATMELTVGGAVVASGEGQDVVLVPTLPEEITWSLTPAETVLPAGAPIVWKFTITGSASGAYVSHTDGNGHTTLTLPVLDSPGGGDTVDPETFYADLATPGIELSFDSPTSDTYQYNWTSDASNVTIDYDVQVDNGSVQLRVLDDAGAVVLDSTVTADFNATADHTGFAPGNWTLEAAFDAFVGSVALDVRPVGAEGSQDDGPQPTEAGGSTQTGSQTGTEGAGDDSGKSSGIPGPGLIAVLALLGVAALVARRR